MLSVVTVMIPVVWTMSREAAFMAQQRGELNGIREAREAEQREAEAELASRLADGYEVVASHVVSGSEREMIVFVLHRRSE